MQYTVDVTNNASVPIIETITFTTIQPGDTETVVVGSFSDLESNIAQINALRGFTALQATLIGAVNDDSPEYAEVDMPSAASVPVGTEVWNTTYKVKLRSNGTRWIPLSQFTVAALTPDDFLTGTTDETLLRAVETPLKYIGPNGRLGVALGQTNASNGNIKTLRVRLGTTSGIGGTSILAVNSTTSGKSIAKHVYAAGSENAQFCSNGNVISDASTANSPLALTEDFTGVGYVNISGQLAASSDTFRLSHVQVVIHPGF